MATLTTDDIADLVIAAQSDLGEGKVTDLTSDLQEYVAMNQLMKKERLNKEAGKDITIRALMNGDENAKNVGENEVDNVNQVDGLVEGTVPWRQSAAAYTWSKLSFALNRTPRQIVNFVKLKRQQSRISLWDLMEANFWGEPTSSTDNLTPFGIRYWIVYNASEGFNGANNSNFSSGPAGISRSTYPRWKNYTAQYTSVTDTDLGDKWRKAVWECKFMSPLPAKDRVGDFAMGAHRYGFYTTWDIKNELNRLARQQNDQLGNDIDPTTSVFQGNPIVAVPYLQTYKATPDPIVGIDWSVFKLATVTGEYMVEQRPEQAPLQHRNMQAFTDCAYNFVCYDCRRQFLLAKSTWH